MARTNSSKFFSNTAFRFPTMKGFPKKTSSRFLSINNESGKSTLYRPALKALVLYLCGGRKVWYDSLTEEEIYNSDDSIVAAVATISDLCVAEYRLSEDKTQIACFDSAKQQFLFAGVSDDNGETWNPYVLDYKNGRNGTVLWLALMPYLQYKTSTEMATVFSNLQSPTDSLGSNYKRLIKGEITELPSSVLSQCFIFCDAAYYCVDREDVAYGIKVGLPSSGVLPQVPNDLSAYVPDEADVLAGMFHLEGFATKSSTPKKTQDITPDELLGMYALNENMSSEDMEKAEHMYPSYVVPRWVLKAAHNIQFNHKLGLPQSMKQNNIFLFGPPGSGKTDGGKAIASALGLPCEHISMSSNSDEFIFTGNIIPEVDGVSEVDTDSTQLEIFQKYKDVSEILEFAEISPEVVYQDITGSEKEDASIADVVEAYGQCVANHKQKNSKESSNGIRYKFVESVFCQAIEQGWLVIIEEFTNVRDAGIAMVINQLMDGYQQITLPTGKVVRRHPNSVIVFASNVDEAQCGEFEASTLSRLKPMYKVDMPSKGDMIKRVKKMTGFTGQDVLEFMADIVIALQKYIKEHALVGVCGVREFAGWVLQYQANCDFDSSLTQSTQLYTAALETIVPSASPHQEDMDEIARDILNTMLSC